MRTSTGLQVIFVVLVLAACADGTKVGWGMLPSVLGEWACHRPWRGHSRCAGPNWAWLAQLWKPWGTITETLRKPPCGQTLPIAGHAPQVMDCLSSRGSGAVGGMEAWRSSL